MRDWEFRQLFELCATRICQELGIGPLELGVTGQKEPGGTHITIVEGSLRYVEAEPAALLAGPDQDR